MKKPETYKEWMDCLDIVKCGSDDSTVLECMNQGTLQFDAGVGGRFAQNFSETIEFRMERASSKFQRANKFHNTSYDHLVRSILLLRKEYNYLIQLSKVPVIPADQSKKLVELLISSADSIQESLEDSSIRLDRTGMLTRTIKTNRVNKLNV